jgi:hypothetical protein
MHNPSWSRFRMRMRALVAASAAALAACGGEARANAASPGADSIAFRDALTPPDPGWTGPVFQLSHAYPDSPPAACTTCPWLDMEVDFGSTDWNVWQPYLDSVLAYAVQGQTPELGHRTGWRTQVNGSTRWFHVPWMAHDAKNGREFVHGTTNERTATLGDFVRLDAAGRVVGREKRLLVGVNSLPGTVGRDTFFETWAVGMYNEHGGYAIGQAIPASGVPVAARNEGGLAMPVRFPVGTVVAKLLFTTATVRQVPYLLGSPEWTVDRHVQDPRTGEFLLERQPQTVRLVQMDLAVRDDRSPIGWVYGTYAYNAERVGLRWWQRLSPVGVQWGNDPNTFPAVDSASSRPIAQTALNRAISIPQHNGCEGRLAGPVDNRKSACTACHGAAYAPAPVGTVSDSTNVLNPFVFDSMCVTANAKNATYFSNVVFPDSYPPFPGVSGPVINLDTSLQLMVAYEQYARWLATQPASAR